MSVAASSTHVTATCTPTRELRRRIRRRESDAPPSRSAVTTSKRLAPSEGKRLKSSAAPKFTSTA
jgi:hypothetical protein